MTEHPASILTKVADPSPAHLEEASTILRAGGVVALPTETVYGLAGDATNADAVAAIYAAKGRPSFNPLIVHVADRAMASRYAQFNQVADRLAAHFWPGSLTMVLPVREDAPLAPAVTAGLPSVAIRVPAHEVMQALITQTGRPLAAPSANASGSISPTCAEHVLRSLGGRIPLIIDAGPTGKGLESTIIAPEDNQVRLLRPGPITADAIAALTGLPVVSASGQKIEAPGQLESHYAPGKPLRLNAPGTQAGEYMIGMGAMDCDYNLSPSGDLHEAASRLFAALHMADLSDRPSIAICPIPMEGIGIAINDRLARAAA